MGGMSGARGLTRRGFIRGVGVAAGAAGTFGFTMDPDRDPGPGQPRDGGQPTRPTKPSGPPRPPRRPPPRPNIVLIVADDMGFSDIGSFGGEIDTPNLDRLAHSGTRFTGMTTNARCVPTRASLLTGLYPTQAGLGYVTQNDGSPQYRGRLSDACVTIGEVLGPSGYHTALFGKWHVARFRSGIIPATRGFERSFGPTGGKSSYFRPSLYRDTQLIGRPSDPDFYLTEAITRETVDSIRDFAGSGEPFVTLVTYSAPHFPLQARPEDVARYRDRYRKGWDRIRAERFARQRQTGLLPGVDTLPPRDPDAPPWRRVSHHPWQIERMAVYAAQVAAMDRGVGQILDTLEQLRIRDNTVVMFLSDNGASAERMGHHSAGAAVSLDGDPVLAGNFPRVRPGPGGTFASYGLAWANASNTPFSRYKHWTTEGGLATPFLVSWPGRLPPGRLDHRLLHVTDLMPTLVELCDADYPHSRNGQRVPLPEGRSFADALGSRPAEDWTPSRRVYWEHEGNRAARHGWWKLVREFAEPWELYDMRTDRAEQHNVAGQHPDIVERINTAWGEWAERVRVRPWLPLWQYR
jgi:arylsulfatase A-like enzyme